MELLMIALEVSQRNSPFERWSARPGPIARARRILDTRLTYIDHPSFDDPVAREAILAPLAHATDEDGSSRFQYPKTPARLPAERTGAPLLSREQEAHLFRKMNYLKHRASQLKEQLDPDWPNPRDLDEIERLHCEALALRNRIVEMNLRLVVAIAKTRVKAGYDLSECISDGNLALIQAVDGFDFARGNRFSTYAVWAIRNTLAEHQRRFIRCRNRSSSLDEQSLRAPDPGEDKRELEEVQNQRRSMIGRWLGQLEKRERRIVICRYGIGGGPRQTLAQIGRELGISKERVRQIAICARAKLRKFARRESVEI
jgi:RNA polymerase primary sigma factor